MALNDDMIERCVKFLRTYYMDEIAELAQYYPSEQRSLVIDWMDMYTSSPDFAEDYLREPSQVRPHLEEALQRIDLPVDVGFTKANVRVTNIGDEREFDLGEYNPQHIGEIIGVKGQIARATPPKPKLREAAYECQRCGTMSYIPADGLDVSEPHECQGCERQGPFRIIEEQSDFVNYQALRIQRPPEQQGAGDAHMDIRLEDDLAGAGVTSGDRVTVTGALSIDPDDTDSAVFDYHVEGEDVRVEEGGYEDIDPEEHREEIERVRNADDPVAILANSVAPHLATDEKLDDILEALVLQMVGTARKDPDAGPTYRGDWHMLLLGDPGTSKSELLEQVETLAPRAKLKSGEGLTQAGMTAAATKDDFGNTEFSLDAGLMVLASGGIACLDEADKADKSALNAAHQALENQRVSVSKGGIDADLPAQTALLAAGNPKHGRFDPYEPVPEQIDLTPALMSRFDLMFMLQDKPDPEWDREVAETVVDAWAQSGRAEFRGEEMEDNVTREISEDAFRAYLALAKQEVFPTIEDDAVADRMIEHYVNLRMQGADEDNAVPVTARKLEAFLRLAESSARARFSSAVEIKDVERAERLVMSSLNDVGIDPETGEYDADVIETGTSTSQRKRMKRVLAVIRDVATDHGGMAPEDEVIDVLEGMGTDEETALETFEELLNKGRIYSPKTDHLKVSD
jgi:replicative DNA helicase Mcm